MKEQPTILTIEKLKKYGCYKCGNNKFTRLPSKIVSSPKNNRSLGYRYLLELNNCPRSLISSVSDVEEVMLKIVQDCHLTAVNHCFHQFICQELESETEFVRMLVECLRVVS